MKAFEVLLNSGTYNSSGSYFPTGQKVSVVPSIDLVSNFNIQGHKYLQTANYIVGLCIDDIGNEDQGFHFGSKVDVVGHIIQTRYNNRQYVIHATSNLKPDDLELKYDARIRDRMKEMFNLILFDPKGKSLRK